MEKTPKEIFKLKLFTDQHQKLEKEWPGIHELIYESMREFSRQSLKGKEASEDKSGKCDIGKYCDYPNCGCSSQSEASKGSKSLEELFLSHQKFAEKRFPNSTWVSSLRGLEREIKEVEGEHINRAEFIREYVDCFMYLLDSMNRAGISMEGFKHQFEEKYNINLNRDWKQNKDGSYSHVK